jgi:hypothetical protein
MKLVFKSSTDITIGIYEGNNTTLEIKLHPFLNFIKIDDKKFTIRNNKGNIFGVEILNID